MNALSLARSLRRRGIPVYALAGSVGNPALLHSNAPSRYVAPTAGLEPADSWMEWLKKEPDGCFLLPCSDEGVEFVARRRSEIEAAGHVAIEANDEVLLAMLDKSRTYELARSVGVPAPNTATLRSADDLGLVDAFEFPCALKPVESHVFVRRFLPSAKGAHVRSREDAVRVLEPILEEGIAMLLTEVVEGTDECCSYYSYLDTDGEPLVHFTKRKLRQYPTRFGLGTYHMTKWLPEVAELGLRFFQGIGLRGMGNVEFKRDRRDGQLKIIECNPRFTNAQPLVLASGIDFGYLAYARLAGIAPPLPGTFRENMGMWFPVEDIRALRDYREDGELTTAAWLRSLLHRQSFALFDWRDPKPSIHNSLRYAGALRRRVNRRLRPVETVDPSDPYSASDPYVAS